MRVLLSILLGIWIIYSFSGCADMLQSLRNESAAIDREADADQAVDNQVSQPSRSRSLSGLSANNVPSLDPPVVRGYGRKLASYQDEMKNEIEDAPSNYRRVTRNDFVDRGGNENSLWDGQGQDNFLFSHNRNREPGDLVTADVEKELRREIQYQLWMTLPPEQRRMKRNLASASDQNKTDPNSKTPPTAGASSEGGNEEKNKDAAEEAAKTNLASTGKDDDLVRMEVAENLGNGLVRVVGQKRVIYRGVARVVEVVALVNNKDIDDGNRVKSSSFLDMKTQVIQ